MQADKMMDQTLDKMLPMIQQQIKASLKTEDQKQKMEKINSILYEEIKNFSQSMINGPMIKIYAKHFNSKDIDELIKFYKSDIGKKMVQQTPIITGELMQNMMQKGMPEFQQKIKQRIKETLSNEK